MSRDLEYRILFWARWFHAKRDFKSSILERKVLLLLLWII